MEQEAFQAQEPWGRAEHTDGRVTPVSQQIRTGRRPPYSGFFVKQPLQRWRSRSAPLLGRPPPDHPSRSLPAAQGPSAHVTSVGRDPAGWWGLLSGSLPGAFSFVSSLSLLVSLLCGFYPTCR